MEIYYERDVIAPNKKEMIGGAVCWFMYLCGFGWIFSLFDWDFTQDKQWYLYQIAYFVCNFVLVLCVFRNFLWRSRCRVGKLLSTAFWGYLAQYGLSVFVAYVLFLFFPVVVNQNNNAISSLLLYNPWPMIISTCVLAPVTEEILVRGMIFAPLCRKNPALGYAVSMLVFAGLHVVSFLDYTSISAFFRSLTENFPAFLQYLPASFVLCWAYQRTRSILGPIVLHGVVNLVSVLQLL